MIIEGLWKRWCVAVMKCCMIQGLMTRNGDSSFNMTVAVRGEGG